MLDDLVDYIDQHGRTDLFALDRSVEDHAVFDSLHDLRLIYLVQQGRKISGHAGRFKVYALDYGAYVDLVEQETHVSGGRGKPSGEAGQAVLVPAAALRLVDSVPSADQPED